MDIEAARTQMIGQQVRTSRVLDPGVLRVLAEVPREAFVPPPLRSLAFADTSVPLDHGQMMMSPQVEGRLLQYLSVRPDERVLEVGTGSGFLTACLARLGAGVTSLEIFPDLADTARQRLREQGSRGCNVEVADVFGWTPDQPYACIAVTGSVPVYSTLFESWLAPGGRLFVIVGTEPVMEALLVTRRENGTVVRESLFETVVTALLNAPQPDPFRF